MVVLLKDDAGFPHPVALNVTPDQIPGLIAQVRAQSAETSARYGIGSVPIMVKSTDGELRALSV